MSDYSDDFVREGVIGQEWSNVAVRPPMEIQAEGSGTSTITTTFPDGVRFRGEGITMHAGDIVTVQRVHGGAMAIVADAEEVERGRYPMVREERADAE